VIEYLTIFRETYNVEINNTYI